MNAHDLLHHPGTYVAVMCVCTVSPVFSWFLAMGLVGSRSRAGRAAWCVGLATPILLLMMLLTRVAALGLGANGLSPLVFLTPPSGGWHPVDAVVVLAPIYAAFHLIATEVAALATRGRRAQDFAVPLGMPVAVLAVFAAFLGAIAGGLTLQQPITEIVGAEVFAAGPIALVALAIWTRSQDRSPRTVEVEEEDDDALEHVDIPGRWRKVGALIEGARSFKKHAGQIDEKDSTGRSLWHAVGGAGAAPGAIDALVDDGVPMGEAWQLGDLPVPTEQLVVSAAILATLREHHLHVLVVCAEPEAAAAAVRAAETTSEGHWPLGPTPAGLVALRKCLADGRLPAVAFLSTEDLSGGGIRALVGHDWAATLGLIVLQGFDRGGPLALTHRVHTVRRLRLVLEQQGTRFGVLFTSHRSRAARALVQQAFPGVSVQDVPLRPRQTRARTVWLADYHFVLRSPANWVRQAAEPVAQAGHRVRVSDPAGHFDDANLAVWEGDVKRTPHFTLAGEASIGLLDATALLAAWHALPHHVSAAEDVGRHHALWSLIDTPVTRYLLGEDRLARLTQSEELPAPAAVAALDNRLIARAHLEAALHETDQERASLAAAFGSRLVDEIAGDAQGHAVRASTSGVVRTPLLARTVDDPGDPLAAVGRTSEIVDSETGVILRVVDALTAPTRYYPRRVFGHRGRRYIVPAMVTDARTRIEVEPVAANVALTTPKLDLRLASKGRTEDEQTHTRGRFAYRSSVHEIIAHETVHGARGADGTEVDYALVETRYRTVARAISFPTSPANTALSHLAACFTDVLNALLLLGEDDLRTVAVDDSWAEQGRAGLLVVERSVQGLGVAPVLDERRVSRSFDWVHAILSACTCAEGCENCTPAPQVASGRLDKAGVLRLLKGEG